VVEIRRAVKQLDITNGLDGRDDLVDHFGSSRFGKVGNTFD
jgi:hypothetical protein